MDKTDIIERIKCYRIGKGLSQKALSIDIGMNVGYINRFECKRDFLPSLETLFTILEVLEVSWEEFFYEDNLNYYNDKEILERVKAVPLEKREAMFKLLEK